MIALICPKCGTAIQVDDARAGGTTRCSACGASVSVPARSTPSVSATELVWSDDVGPPPVRRREVPPPPVIDIVGADELAQGQARSAPRTPRKAEPQLDSRHASGSQFTDAELGVSKPVPPIQPAPRRERHFPQTKARASSVGVGSIVMGCLSSFVGLLVLIGAIVMVAHESLEATPKLIVFLVVLCTGLFLLIGGVVLSVYKGMMGQ
jgi:hypothetical protein